METPITVITAPSTPRQLVLCLNIIKTAGIIMTVELNMACLYNSIPEVW
jgi:hypothetical protein